MLNTLLASTFTAYTQNKTNKKLN